MMLMVIVLLVVLGLVFGSFINALVWRVRQQEQLAKRIGNRESRIENRNKKFPIPNSQFSILYGRSMCPHCRHELAARDLVPVLSWLSLRGRCRYCRKPISVQYPLVELAAAAVFALSYAFWPGNLAAAGQQVLLATWLAAAVGLLALLVYDAKWMLLPNRILYPAFFVALAGRLVYIFGFAPNKSHSILLLIYSVLVASGVFWLLFTVSKGRWIGYGDVQLGLVTGTLLASPALSFLMIFLASILGTLAALPDLIRGRKTISSKLPFGPFLITATAIAVLFGDSIINGYENLFLP